MAEKGTVIDMAATKKTKKPAAKKASPSKKAAPKAPKPKAKKGLLARIFSR
jgi:hypothetical protein